MNRTIAAKVSLLLLLALSACYSAPRVDGFESEQWKASLEACDSYRLDHVQLLLDAEKDLKGTGQNGIQQLLGKPTRHELYNRNQKFFFYDLNCGAKEKAEQITIRFDALGKFREISREMRP